MANGPEIIQVIIHRRP